MEKKREIILKKRVSKILTFLSVGFLLAIIDVLSKIWVFVNMEVGDSIPIIKDFFHITYTQNRGMVFGWFYGQVDVFFTVSVIGLLIIAYVYYMVWSELDHISNTRLLGLSFIVGGALGNSFDRFFRAFVIDFIDFNGLWHFIFNFADVFVWVGFILLVINEFIKPYETK